MITPEQKAEWAALLSRLNHSAFLGQDAHLTQEECDDLHMAADAIRALLAELDAAEQDARRGWFWADLYHDTKSPNQTQYTRDLAAHRARIGGD